MRYSLVGQFAPSVAIIYVLFAISDFCVIFFAFCLCLYWWRYVLGVTESAEARQIHRRATEEKRQKQTESLRA